MKEDATGPLELLSLAIGCPAAATQEEDRLIQRTYSYGGDHLVFKANLQLKDVTPDGLEDSPRLPSFVFRVAYKDLGDVTSRKNFVALKCIGQRQCVSITRKIPEDLYGNPSTVQNEAASVLTLRVCPDSVVDVTDALKELLRLNKE